MQDGGLGASYFSVVDPKRGEVFFQPFAEITSSYNDNFKLLFYKEDDWAAILEARGNDYYEGKDAFPTARAKVKPNKILTYDLNKLLKNKVIQRKHTMEYLDAGLKYVKLYLWRANDDDGAKPFVLGTVKRQVASAAPLRPTLEELFRGTTKDEEEKGFSSPTFGMKFEGVVLKNGVTTVRFSQPKDQRNHGTQAPSIFFEAIEKTAKQFPTVKKVVVCGIGETYIDAQEVNPFPRCK
ncbi:MAG: GerMN domain-containing protein [Blastocatellia bacterium]|nr:GerMN domain-containing protein [Blastocatellia bacterium]